MNQNLPQSDPFDFASTGEDFPDEWPMKESDILLGWIGGWSGLARAMTIFGALGVGYAILQPTDSNKQAIAKRSLEDPHLTGAVK